MSFRPYRFPGNALQNVGPGSFQSHYECRIAGRDLKDPEILTPELFLNCRDTLRAGDEVTICGYASQTWDRLNQFVRIRIYKVAKTGVKFMLDGKVTDIPYEEDEEKPEVIEKAFVRKEFGGGFNVFDKDDNLLGNFKTKQEAVEAKERVDAGEVV